MIKKLSRQIISIVLATTMVMSSYTPAYAAEVSGLVQDDTDLVEEGSASVGSVQDDEVETNNIESRDYPETEADSKTDEAENLSDDPQESEDIIEKDVKDADVVSDTDEPEILEDSDEVLMDTGEQITVAINYPEWIKFADDAEVPLWVAGKPGESITFVIPYPDLGEDKKLQLMYCTSESYKTTELGYIYGYINPENQASYVYNYVISEEDIVNGIDCQFIIGDVLEVVFVDGEHGEHYYGNNVPRKYALDDYFWGDPIYPGHEGNPNIDFLYYRPDHGYMLKGLYYSEEMDGTCELYIPGADGGSQIKDYMLTDGKLYVYAKWEPVQAKIYLSSSMSEFTVEYGKTFPVFEGQTYDRYYVTVDGVEKDIIPGETIFDENINYYTECNKVTGNLEYFWLYVSGGKAKAQAPAPKDFSEMSVSAASKTYAYKRANYTTAVTVTDVNGKKLSAGKDYSKQFIYYYAEDTKLLDGTERAAGTEAGADDIVPGDTLMLVTVIGMGNYEGAASATYRVVSQDIAKASVTIPNQFYTGSPVQPGYDVIQIKLGDRYLTSEDYVIVSYENNIEKGKAKVNLEGIGDYGGKKTVTFTIELPPAAFAVAYVGNGATKGKMTKQTDAKGVGIKIAANKYTREGYTFDGWNDDPDGLGTEYESGDVLRGAAGQLVTLYAQWIPGTFSITYHTNGGNNNPDNVKLSYTPEDETFEILPPLEAEWPIGYQFGGWYSEGEYKNKITRVKTDSSGDLNLYAKWVPYNYTVKFDGNGKTSGTMADTTFSFGVSKNLPANKYKRTGSAFLGWGLTEDGEVVIGDKGDLATQVGRELFRNNFDLEITLYAVWENSFTVEYDVPDSDFPAGTAVVRAYKYGNKLALPKPVRKGYSFGGWYTDEIFKTKIKSITAKTYGDLKLHAKWTPLKFTIIYNGNGSDSGKMKNQTLNYEQSTMNLSSNIFVKKGMKFTGWNTAAEGEGYPVAYDEMMGAYADIPIGTLIEDSGIFAGTALKNNLKITLYARWTATDYSISYETYGGELAADAPTSYVFGGEGFDLPEPEKAGDAFLGWYMDPAYKKKIAAVTPATYGNLTLYAMWQNGAKESYKVIFDADAPEGTKVTGRMSAQKMTYNVAKVITNNKFKIKGYTFRGWSLLPAAKREGLGADYENKEKVTGFALPGGPIDEKEYQPEVRLYAVWEKDIYTVVINNINAPEIKDAIATFTYSADQVIVISGPRKQGSPIKYIGDEDEDTEAAIRYLAEPTRMGDTFLGWYTDSGCKKKFSGIKAGTTGDKVLYAKWKTTKYTINYNLNAGGDPSAVLITDKVGYITGYKDKYESGYVLATATRDYYAFGGWYKDKACTKWVGNVIGSPYVDMTVYAKWLPDTYKVVFEKNCPEATGAMKAMTGVSYDAKKKLTKNGFKLPGYELDFWCTVPDPTEENPGFRFANQEEILGRQLVEQGLIDDKEGCLTLYAQWKLKEYKIIYHINGGTNGEGNPVVYNVLTEVAALADPILEGYKFLGWYRDNLFTIPVIQNAEDPEDPANYAIPKGTTGELHFYAKWQYKTIDIDDLNDDEYINVVTDERYKADNTGAADAVDAINNALVEAAENAREESGPTVVYLPEGTYSIRANFHKWNRAAIQIRTGTTLILDDNALLDLQEDHDQDEIAAIGFFSVSNASLIGGKLIGHGDKYTAKDSGGDRDQYGVWIKGSSNITVANFEVTEMFCDGIYITEQIGIGTSYGNDGVNIMHCTIHGNRRNNVAILDADNVIMDSCNVYDSGNRSPHCCICVEPNDTASGDIVCSNLYFRNCTIKTNKPGNDWRYRCFYTYNGSSGHKGHVAEEVTFDNCQLQGYFGNHHGKDVFFINGTTLDGTKDENPNVNG